MKPRARTSRATMALNASEARMLRRLHVEPPHVARSEAVERRAAIAPTTGPASTPSSPGAADAVHIVEPSHSRVVAASDAGRQGLDPARFSD